MVIASKSRPRLDGLYHIKLAVSDLDRSLDFYQKVFDARIVPGSALISEDDRSDFTSVLDIPGLGNIKLHLRQHFAQAMSQRTFDPIALAVDNHIGLRNWADFLDTIKIEHTPVRRGSLGWVLSLQDPDEIGIRMFAPEERAARIPRDTVAI